MKTLLVVHSSPKKQGSVTRDLTAELLEKWQAANPESNIINRDIGINPPPHLTEDTINAFYTPPDERTEDQQKILTLSEELIAELRAADEIVIASPMHNFSISSGLKAWIDHVARVGETFRYTDKGPQGLLEDRPVYVITASGGDYRPHTSIAFLNHQDTYLKVALNFIGLQDIRLIQAAGVAGGEAPIQEARKHLTEVINAG